MAPRQRETQSAHRRPSPLKAPSHGHNPYHQPSFTLPRPNSFPICSKRVGSSSGPLPFFSQGLTYAKQESPSRPGAHPRPSQSIAAVFRGEVCNVCARRGHAALPTHILLSSAPDLPAVWRVPRGSPPSRSISGLSTGAMERAEPRHLRMAHGATVEACRYSVPARRQR